MSAARGSDAGAGAGAAPEATAVDVARYDANRQAEVDSASLYRALAAAEPTPQLAEVYRRLATDEEAHVAFWEARLRAAGQPVPTRRPRWRARTLARFARRFGPQIVLPVVIGNEAADRGTYDRQPEARGSALPADERSHERILRAIGDATPRGLEGSAIARLEGRHRAVGGNALRAAVLGANDGLVSNLSLVMGVAGAAVTGRGVLVTGLAGLVAGAGSMAMGEWLSVQSSRELYQRQIAIERDELAADPAGEAHELTLIYQAKGLSEEQARTLAERMIASEATALDTLAREELGIDPDELGGSAWEAASTSFVLFAIGAVIPVLPFMLLTGRAAIGTSLALSTAALCLIGAGITLLTGRSVLYSAARQLLFGLGAAGLTYAVGRVIGVSVG